MLHEHEVDFIEHTLQCLNRCGAELPDYMKAKVERSQQIVRKFYERKIAEQTNAYADALGCKPSQALMNDIAADCARHGSN